MIRVILVDDRKSHLARLRNELARFSGDIEIIGEYIHQDEAVARIIQQQPDALFLDVEMPGQNGFQLAAAVRPICNTVIYLTSYEKYGTDSYRHQALYYIVKDRIAEFLPEAVARLKVRIMAAATTTLLTGPVPNQPAYRLQRISIGDSRKAFFTFSQAEKEVQKEVLLTVESYRTLSNFACYKLLETVSHTPDEFLVNYKRDEKTFSNLSQEKANFLKNVNEQVKGMPTLLPDVFFMPIEKGYYTLTVYPRAITFNCGPQGLKLWAESYLKQVIRLRSLAITYKIDGNEIRISRKQGV